MSYDAYAKTAMCRVFENKPDVATTVAEVYGRLKRGGYYEQALVDAVFQKWDRLPLELEDAWSFFLVYADIVMGKVRVARINVGCKPSRDDAVEINCRKLKKLQPQFSAAFWEVKATMTAGLNGTITSMLGQRKRRGQACARPGTRDRCWAGGA